MSLTWLTNYDHAVQRRRVGRLPRIPSWQIASPRRRRRVRNRRIAMALAVIATALPFLI